MTRNGFLNETIVYGCEETTLLTFLHRLLYRSTGKISSSSSFVSTLLGVADNETPRAIFGVGITVNSTVSPSSSALLRLVVVAYVVLLLGGDVVVLVRTTKLRRRKDGEMDIAGVQGVLLVSSTHARACTLSAYTFFVQKSDSKLQA